MIIKANGDLKGAYMWNKTEIEHWNKYIYSQLTYDCWQTRTIIDSLQ